MNYYYFKYIYIITSKFIFENFASSWISLCFILAIGPFCDLKQDVKSWNHTEGATVAIEMQEYERERKLTFIFYQ